MIAGMAENSARRQFDLLPPRTVLQHIGALDAAAASVTGAFFHGD